MHYPKKSLGQNFLIDKNISIKIVKLIDNIQKKNIIEIGPGKGALTEIILKNNPKKIILIEKDKNLFKDLISKYKNNKIIDIYNADALNFDFSIIKKPKTILANLPYNISIKLIINWLTEINEYNEIVVMIQREVAKKMDYNNTNKKNRLNVLTQITSYYKIEFNVSNNVFFPKPKIISSVIKLKPKKNPNINFIQFENFTRMLFRNKRKKIINVIPKDKLKLLNLMNNNTQIKDITNSRAEDLTFENINDLFKQFSKFSLLN